jgi:hypothetical protein
VPADRLTGVLEMITEGAAAVGFIREFSGRRYVDLADPGDPVQTTEADEASKQASTAALPPRPLPVGPTAPTTVSVGQGIHINIEIHIAADASSETIENIFRNMRRYVLSPDGQPDNDTSNAE